MLLFILSTLLKLGLFLLVMGVLIDTAIGGYRLYLKLQRRKLERERIYHHG